MLSKIFNKLLRYLVEILSVEQARVSSCSCCIAAAVPPSHSNFSSCIQSVLLIFRKLIFIVNSTRPASYSYYGSSVSHFLFINAFPFIRVRSDKFFCVLIYNFAISCTTMIRVSITYNATLCQMSLICSLPLLRNH